MDKTAQNILIKQPPEIPLKTMAQVFNWVEMSLDRSRVSSDSLKAIDRLYNPTYRAEILAGIKAHGITAEILKKWASVYIYQMYRNPMNAVAPGRALLMMRAVQTFFPEK